MLAFLFVFVFFPAVLPSFYSFFCHSHSLSILWADVYVKGFKRTSLGKYVQTLIPDTDIDTYTITHMHICVHKIQAQCGHKKRHNKLIVYCICDKTKMYIERFFALGNKDLVFYWIYICSSVCVCAFLIFTSTSSSLFSFLFFSSHFRSHSSTLSLFGALVPVLSMHACVNNVFVLSVSLWVYNRLSLSLSHTHTHRVLLVRLCDKSDEWKGTVRNKEKPDK